MHTIYDIIKKYGAGKGEATMWSTTRTISDALLPMKDEKPEEYWALVKKIYADMAGPHFNEEFGQWQIEQMYYVDKDGHKVPSPHWNKSQYQMVYENNRNKLKKPYTAWDLAVTIEMLYSDYNQLLHEWLPGATDSEIDSYFVHMAIVYLNDPDDPDEGKIWHKYNK